MPNVDSGREDRNYGRTGLASLSLETEYRSGKGEPVQRFYRPCLQRATIYRRAVGYFRSTVFAITGFATIEFAKRGGKLLLICSPELDHNDIDAIALGYARRAERITQVLMAEFDGLLADHQTNYAARILATLIAFGSLEIKLAVRADRKGLYHEKIGIFSDSEGSLVSFKGSTNETWSGWHDKGNFESIEVFCSWRGGLEAERVGKHISHFDQMWAENDPDVEVFRFPIDGVEHLKKSAYRSFEEMPTADPLTPAPRRSPMAHQATAVAAWEKAGCRGIFEHATGSGKTFTAIVAIRRHASAGLPSLVVVPSQLLLDQWAGELREEIPDAALILAGGGNNRWRARGLLGSMTDEDSNLGGRIVLATMQTASSTYFRDAIRGGDHLLLVADEVHQAGSSQNSKLMEIPAGKRLGLSATPTRYGDPVGTNKIFDYFGAVIAPAITLNDAITAGRLVPYEYHPHLVNLSATEAEEWRELTRAIQLECVRQKRDSEGDRAISERAKLLLIRRSRIAKKASAKVLLAAKILVEDYREGQSWLVYCEDSAQLSEVIEKMRASGLSPVEYHSNMAGDKLATMAWFRKFGGILVSIRCLDEGVDIPAVSHALILASSQNPRQFIQRRGRVLRKSGEKEIAVVHDAVVVPLNVVDEPEQESLLLAELMRAMEFADNAINRSAGADLRGLLISLGIDLEAFTTANIDDEEVP